MNRWPELSVSVPSEQILPSGRILLPLLTKTKAVDLTLLAGFGGWIPLRYIETKRNVAGILLAEQELKIRVLLRLRSFPNGLLLTHEYEINAVSVLAVEEDWSKGWFGMYCNQLMVVNK